MSTTELYFEVIADYGGVEGDANYISVKKGDVVRLIKKKHKYLKVSKDGHIGKVPKRILVQKIFKIKEKIKRTRIPGLIMKILKERIYPLIHLNCTTDLNCQQCINIRQSPAILELKSAVFKALYDASCKNYYFRNILVNDHNIILHLIHLLIQYVGVLVIAISTASGSGEEYDNKFSHVLDFISDFIRSLNKGKIYYATFPPQPLLARRSEEQIEEEGGNEEIESQLINKENSGNIKNNANEAKGAILNYFIEQGNRKPDQY
ncbi:MAG: hypothetical protein EZS28_020465 [Streblomastix strix]|uniref:SH3 domain-containing protein n=1 Tax=Streblomastix strix TaxID=222440 RepID=A0A5J4VN55_9EUKA|nr:MAG: hypothetical protein EZS28_020465 [Streblomastix strix]